jgi:hypothetical protein
VGEVEPLSAVMGPWNRPLTEAVRRALRAAPGDAAIDDLLFLEAWEMHPPPDIGSTLRAGQIRRANPSLAEEIRAELKGGRLPPVSSRPQ